ncbi:MAG: NINE protein [Alphaproteobacteria bacterium]|nr:NINE protein [Alphaproteobacteria bacterium]MBR0212493.1 NINE protein [Alphaproteobacteria bacterium]
MAMIYCRECGARHSDKAKACPKCGYVQYDFSKSIAIYLLLCWFLGVFGAHRFYAGKPATGVVMFILSCTIVGLFVTGIWTIIDFIVGVCNIKTPEKVFAEK